MATLHKKVRDMSRKYRNLLSLPAFLSKYIQMYILAESPSVS